MLELVDTWINKIYLWESTWLL